MAAGASWVVFLVLLVGELSDFGAWRGDSGASGNANRRTMAPLSQILRATASDRSNECVWSVWPGRYLAGFSKSPGAQNQTSIVEALSACSTAGADTCGGVTLLPPGPPTLRKPGPLRLSPPRTAEALERTWTRECRPRLRVGWARSEIGSNLTERPPDVSIKAVKPGSWMPLDWSAAGGVAGMPASFEIVLRLYCNEQHKEEHSHRPSRSFVFELDSSVPHCADIVVGRSDNTQRGGVRIPAWHHLSRAVRTFNEGAGVPRPWSLKACICSNQTRVWGRVCACTVPLRIAFPTQRAGEVDDEGSCALGCGMGHLSRKGGGTRCWCDAFCERASDCCKDYWTACQNKQQAASGDFPDSYGGDIVRNNGSFKLKKKSQESVLVIIPVKDCHKCIPKLTASLVRFNHPREALHVCFLESDSSDHLTSEALRKAKRNLTRAFATTRYFRSDFSYESPKDRHSIRVQSHRRSVLAQSRNKAVELCYGGQDWVVWLDADMVQVKPNLIQRLMAVNHRIVAPNVVVESAPHRSYDLNTWVELKSPKSIQNGHPIFEGYDRANWEDEDIGKRSYLSDYARNEETKETNLVPVDGVGTAVLLVSGALHRMGVPFAVEPYKRRLESEGFSLLARDLGARAYGMPDFRIPHGGC